MDSAACRDFPVGSLRVARSADDERLSLGLAGFEQRWQGGRTAEINHGISVSDQSRQIITPPGPGRDAVTLRLAFGANADGLAHASIRAA